MKKILLIITMLSLLAVACSEAPCSEQASDFMDESADLFDRFTDAVAIADSTSRISLAGPVGNLQDLRREAEALTPPECAVDVQTELVSAMDYTVEGFLAFMSQEEDATVGNYFDLAADALGRYAEARSNVNNPGSE